MSEESGEKSFDPTPKRKRDAAEKGDVLRGRDLGTAAAVLAGLGWLALAGPGLAEALMGLLRAGFSFDRAALEGGGARDVVVLLPAVFLPVVALGLIVPAAAVAAQLAFGDGRWVPANLAFKGSRIDPLAGLKRMFGLHGLVEMGKGLVKVALLGAIAAAWAAGQGEALAELGRATLARQMALAWDALLSLVAALAAGLVVVAAIDLPLQWLQRNRRLRMSQQDMREEMKESEGSPEMRAMRRQRQRSLAAGALAPAMREAQFVVTNPTHFSVALAWNPARAPAPVVVAKGRGEKALAIRELAAGQGLPVLEYPPLARALYFTTRETQMIREELYIAVAAVVAFVLAVRRGETPPRPQVEVPVALRFDADGRPLDRAGKGG